MKNLLLLTVLLVCFVIPVHIYGQTLDVNQGITGKTSKANQYDFDYRIVVTPPYKTKKLQVWLPLAQSDAAQKIGKYEIETFPQVVEPTFHTETKYGNRFAYFEFLNPKGAQIISLKFQAEVSNVHWSLDLATVEPVTDWPTSFASYLDSEFDAETQKQFDSVLAKAIPEKSNSGLDLQAVIKWTDDNLSYSQSNASLTADAKHAVEQRQGHCSDYHGLCSALGRKLGYPARVTYGLATMDKASPSHCKLEVYLPPHGWVTFDVSETQKLIKLINQSDLSDDEKLKREKQIRARLLAGFRDNTWLQVTKGTNYQLAPPTNQPSIPLVRTIYAEADGKPLPEPSPSNAAENKFSWMTAYSVKAAKPVTYPYKDLDSVSNNKPTR